MCDSLAFEPFHKLINPFGITFVELLIHSVGFLDHHRLFVDFAIILIALERHLANILPTESLDFFEWFSRFGLFDQKIQIEQVVPYVHSFIFLLVFEFFLVTIEAQYIFNFFPVHKIDQYFLAAFCAETL